MKHKALTLTSLALSILSLLLLPAARLFSHADHIPDVSLTTMDVICLLIILIPIAAVITGTLALWRTAHTGSSALIGLAVIAICLGTVWFAIGGVNITRSITYPYRLDINMAAVVNSLRAVDRALVQYAQMHPDQGFPKTFAQLAKDNHGDKLLSVIAARALNGYSYVYIAGLAADGKVKSFRVIAEPKAARFKGAPFFSLDESGLIRYGMSFDSANETIID